MQCVTIVYKIKGRVDKLMRKGNVPEEIRPELAAEVKRLLRKFSPNHKPLTSREAADLTGLSHATVAKMVRGLAVGRFATQKLAERLGGDVETLLTLSGYRVEEIKIVSKGVLSGSEADNPIIKPLMRLETHTSPLQFEFRENHLTQGMEAYVESWSRGVQIFGPMLEPNFRPGDVLLIQERFGRLDGGEFLVFHNESYETGFFITVNDRNYQWNGDGTPLCSVSEEYRFLGKIVGCLRES